MKAALKIFFGVLFSFAMAQDLALAQVKLQSHVLELQNRIEGQINRNLTDLIATQLAPTTFDVATRVKVAEIPNGPAKPPDKKRDTAQMPAGMDLGSVDVREVIDSYKNEIEELKAFKESTKEEKAETRYSIARVEIVVGLSDSYDDAYVAQFQDWLSKRVKLDYGPTAIASVNKSKPLPLKEPVGPNWRDFLPLFAYAFLALAMVLAAWFIARGLTRLGEGSKNFTIEHKNPFALDHNQKVEEVATNKNEEIGHGENDLPALEEPVAEDLEHLQAGEELIGKITYLCLELGKGVNDLVRFWLDNGNEGFLKTAVLVDMIVTLKERVSVETAAANTAHKEKFGTETAAAIATLKIPLDQDLASSYGVNLSEAYREAAQMNDEAKVQFLEKIYWDLLQIKTIGAQNMRKPFDYLQSMNDMAYSEVLNSQSDEGKALALMFGDANKTKMFLSNVDGHEKAKIVQNMMSLSQVSKKQIWDTDSSMKLKLINSSMNPEENLVNLFPRTIDMLNTLSPLDEIKVLRQVVSTLPDQGVTVKQQHTTLAFIDEWHEEFIAKLVKVSTPAELVQLIHLIPEAEGPILNVCPDKMKMIISDDIKMQMSDDNTMAKAIRQLKGKWKNICTTENIAMGNVVNIGAQRADWLKNAG